jgi:DNA-binding NarL/FixJ family response regulator
MPELNGPELAEQIASLRPGIKVIFTSGYSSETIARRGSLDPAVAFIPKPYRPKALARRIREVLNASLLTPLKRELCSYSSFGTTARCDPIDAAIR